MFDYERLMMSELAFDKVTDKTIIATINPSSFHTIIDGKFKFYWES